MNQIQMQTVSLAGVECASFAGAECACANQPPPISLGLVQIGLQLQDLSLRFEVASDEEYVHLRVSGTGRLFDMGGRRHNYFLLTLARRRLKDAAAQHPDARCGWMYHDELTRGLTGSRLQLNSDVFRVRKQFAAIGLLDPAAIIERRVATGQLRIGTGNFTIVSC